MRQASKAKSKDKLIASGIVSKRNDHACYVLITCGEPTADGRMQVEMTYEGDPTLAAYLLASAQGFIETDEDTFSH